MFCTYFSGSSTFNLNKPIDNELLRGDLFVIGVGEGILPAIETILLLTVTSGWFVAFIPGVWATIIYDLYWQNKERNQ